MYSPGRQTHRQTRLKHYYPAYAGGTEKHNLIFFMAAVHAPFPTGLCRCLKCDNLCAWSADVRTVNNQHYIVVDSTLPGRIIVKPHPKPLSYDGWVKKEKIYCKQCGQDWGIKAIYKSVPCCVIKIISFVIVDPCEKRSWCKKWKSVNFPVAELSDQDMMDLVEFETERVSQINGEV